MFVVGGFLGSHNACYPNESEMRVIDENTGRVVWSTGLTVEDPPTSNVYMVAMSPSGQFMVSAGADRSALSEHDRYNVATSSYDNCHWTLWDVETGAMLKEGPTTPEGDFKLAFSPCGGYFATGQTDGRVIIYNANNGVLLKTMEHETGGYTARINAVSFSCDGKHIAASTRVDGCKSIWSHMGPTKSYNDVVIWNSVDADVDTVAGSFFMALASCGLVTTFIADVNFSPVDENIIALASYRGCIDIIDIARKTRNHRIDGQWCGLLTDFTS